MIWLDQAKGLGIVLVVFGHCLRGLMAAGLANEDGPWGVVDAAIYAFHMPLFFFLAGHTFEASALKRSPGAYLVRRSERLLWPLALWTWIFNVFKLAAGPSANAAVTLDSFPFFPLPPRDHMWFLWALYLVSLAAYLLGPFWRRRMPLPVWGLYFVGAALLALDLPAALASPWFTSAATIAPHFVAGVLLARIPWRARVEEGGSLPVTLGALSAFAVPVALAASGRPIPVVGGTIASVALCVLLVARPAPDRLGRGLSTLGQASLAIYVMHTIASAALRVALLKVGFEELAVHLVLGTLIGVLAPLAAYFALRRLGWLRLAGL